MERTSVAKDTFRPDSVSRHYTPPAIRIQWRRNASRSPSAAQRGTTKLLYRPLAGSLIWFTIGLRPLRFSRKLCLHTFPPRKLLDESLSSREINAVPRYQRKNLPSLQCSLPQLGAPAWNLARKGFMFRVLEREDRRVGWVSGGDWNITLADLRCGIIVLLC